VSGTANRTQERTAKRYAQAIARLERAERKLSAAFTRWQKARDSVRRYELRADKHFGRIGGEADIRTLARERS